MNNTTWECHCGNTGIYKGIAYHDDSITVFVCYCDVCRKEYYVFKEKNELYTLESLI